MNISTWIGLILIYDRVRALQIEPTEAAQLPRGADRAPNPNFFAAQQI